MTTRIQTSRNAASFRYNRRAEIGPTPFFTRLATAHASTRRGGRGSWRSLSSSLGCLSSPLRRISRHPCIRLRTIELRIFPPQFLSSNVTKKVNVSNNVVAPISFADGESVVVSRRNEIKKIANGDSRFPRTRGVVTSEKPRVPSEPWPLSANRHVFAIAMSSSAAGLLAVYPSEIEFLRVCRLVGRRGARSATCGDGYGARSSRASS